MEAQIAAAPIGAQRFLDLVKRYGHATVKNTCEDLKDYSERPMRAAMGAIPDGVYKAQTFIDGYIDDPGPGRRDLPIAVTIPVAGEKMAVDLEGTAFRSPTGRSICRSKAPSIAPSG